MWVLLRIGVSLGVVGCHCRPDPSPPPSETDEPRETGGSTGDTAPPPRCDWPELEPNNTAASATPLAVDVGACGAFQNPNDPDFWEFELPVTTWLGVWLDARENGSFANPALILAGPDGLVVRREDGDETADARLLFPAPAGSYTITALEQAFQGDANGRWFYDVMATVQKAPRTWTTAEVEPNGGRPSATALGDGDAAWGVLSTGDDQDWFAIAVPEGRHALTAHVDAFGLGSPADTVLTLQRADGSSPGCGPSNAQCRFPRGEIGFERDPWLRYTSEGDETLYVRVQSEDELGSIAHWYVLEISLEAP